MSSSGCDRPDIHSTLQDAVAPDAGSLGPDALGLAREHTRACERCRCLLQAIPCDNLDIRKQIVEALLEECPAWDESIWKKVLQHCAECPGCEALYEAALTEQRVEMPEIGSAEPAQREPRPDVPVPPESAREPSMRARLAQIWAHGRSPDSYRRLFQAYCWGGILGMVGAYFVAWSLAHNPLSQAPEWLPRAAAAVGLFDGIMVGWLYGRALLLSDALRSIKWDFATRQPFWTDAGCVGAGVFVASLAGCLLPAVLAVFAGKPQHVTPPTPPDFFLLVAAVAGLMPAGLLLTDRQMPSHRNALILIVSCGLASMVTLAALEVREPKKFAKGVEILRELREEQGKLKGSEAVKPETPARLLAVKGELCFWDGTILSLAEAIDSPKRDEGWWDRLVKCVLPGISKALVPVLLISLLCASVVGLTVASCRWLIAALEQRWP